VHGGPCNVCASQWSLVNRVESELGWPHPFHIQTAVLSRQPNSCASCTTVFDTSLPSSKTRFGERRSPRGQTVRFGTAPVHAAERLMRPKRASEAWIERLQTVDSNTRCWAMKQTAEAGRITLNKRGTPYLMSCGVIFRPRGTPNRLDCQAPHPGESMSITATQLSRTRESGHSQGPEHSPLRPRASLINMPGR
jgi:hypothetical protein